MAWSRLQSCVGSAASANPSATFTTANLTSGSVMVAAVVTTGTETLSSVKDGAGNSFTQIGVKAGTNNHVYLYALATPAGDAGTKPTITATKSANVNPSAILVQEVSGILATVDGTLGSLSGTGGTSTGSPTYTSTASNEYLVSVYGDNGGPETWTNPAALTADANSINSNGNADLAIAFGNSTGGTEAGSWALTGTSADWSTLLVAFQLPSVSVSLTTPNLALAAPAVTVSAGASVSLTTPNLALGAPALLPGVLPPISTGSWSGSYARNPVSYAPGPPVMAPLAVPVTNTAGDWMFAVASWRQDAGIAGTLQYPTTVTISDDAHNFWIPVESGQSAASAGSGGTPAPTVITRGNVSSFYAGTNSGTITWSSAPVAGQTVLVSIWGSSAVSITSVIDNGTSPSTFVLDASHFGSGGRAWIYRANGISLSDHGSYQVTITATGGGDVQAGGVAYSGVKSGTPTATSFKGATSTSVSTGSVIPTGAGALYFASFVDASSANPETITLTGTGFTQQFVETNGSAQTNGAAADKIDSGGPASTQCTWTLGDSVAWDGLIAVYEVAPSPVVGTSSSGIIRTAVWMAPAARAAEFVFFSPTGYQSGMTAQVFSFAGVCPWYQAGLRAEVYANQSSSITLTETPGGDVFTLGVIAYDLVASSPALTAPGWSSPVTTTVINGSNTSGDMAQATYFATGSGVALTLSGATTTSMDWATVIVAVSGLLDVLPYPYGTPALENWPVLVTETAAGPALNADPFFAQGVAQWSGSGAAIAAVSQPLWSPVPQAYQPNLYGSAQATPSGSAMSSGLVTADYAVTAGVLYTALAQVYSPSGFGLGLSTNGAAVSIQWKTSGHVLLATTSGITTSLMPGEWTPLSVGPVEAPAGAAFAALLVAEVVGTGTVPASAVFFTGYASFSAADSYEGASPDQLTWSDISSRVFTQGSIGITRGIQFEQQSLEAGTLTIYVANNDGFFTFGNVLSPYYPNVGDTDIPIRLRAVWPGSVTPYAVLFSGYTDAITYGIDSGTYYGYAEIQASDAWSRLTQQMLGLIEQEALVDGPAAFIPCNQTGANIVVGTAFSNTPAVPVLTSTSAAVSTAALPAQNFGGNIISLPGSPGLSCWQATGTNLTATGNIGWALTWMPTSATLPLSSGITLEFWFSPLNGQSAQPTGNLTVASANAGSGNPIWQLYINNTAGTQTALTYLNLWTWNSDGTFNGSTVVGTAIPFLTAAAAVQSYYFVVNFTQNQVTVTVNPGGTPTETVTVTGLNLSSQCTGFSWLGFTSASVNAGVSSACMDGGIADIGIYGTTVPAARSAAHYQAALTGFQGEPDTWRLARIASYSGFTPVLGMRALDLPAVPAADVDIVTAATDTTTQTVSTYFTNVAQSTLALMFVDGPGTLVYRRRMEWYDRPVGQWVAGENDSQFLSLGINPLNDGSTIAGWTTGNGATLVTGTAPAGGPLFTPAAGLFAGNGSTASPFIATSSNPAVTPGQAYQFTVWLFSNQGWSPGLNAQLQFYTAGNALISTTSGALFSISPGSVAYSSVGPVQAPASAAYLKAVVLADGTPPSSTGFYVAAAQVSQVPADPTGGAAASVPETPYLSDVQVSSDRTQLYNYTQLTQYGNTLISSFSGTSVLFTPSSGVIVIISNDPSILLRGQVPYTATIYLDNTSQTMPYYLYSGSIEDFGSWIVQTLGSPLFRPDKITLSTVATPSSTITGVFSEVGDTVNFRRRPLGSPQLEIPAYFSKMNQTIDVASGEWTSEMDLSPFPQGSVIACDDVVFGVLTGQNFIGW